MLTGHSQNRPTPLLALLLALAVPLALALLAAPPAPAEAHSSGHVRHKRHVTRHGRKTARKHAHKHASHPAGQSAPAAPFVSPVTAPGHPPVTPPAKTPATPAAPTPPAATVPTGASSLHSAPPVSVTCEAFAAPSGSDSAGDGSLAHPYQTVVKLDRALSAGQTGCLRGGSYGSTNTHHELTNSGTATGQITLTAYPGETATIVGWVDVEAAYTTLAGLQIDGSNDFYNMSSDPDCPGAYSISQGLDLNGTGDVFERNNFFESVASLRGQGIGIGFWGDADNTIVRYNRVHDVGSCTQHDHLIYLDSGNNVQIYDNWLYNDHNGYGIAAYPAPTNARITANVIDNAGSGVNFGDTASSTNSGNEFWHNVVSNEVNVPSDGGGKLEAALVMCPELNSSSTGNAVFENDSFANPNGISAVNSHLSAANISLSNNVSVDPQYVNSAANNYSLAPGSPVASWGLWNGA